MVVNKLSLPQTSHIYTYGVVCLWMRKNVLRQNGCAKAVAPNCPASCPPTCICARFAALPLFLCSRPPYTAIICPRRFGGPVCDNAEPFLFSGWSSNLERASLRSEAPPKRYMCSVSPAFEDCSLPLGLSLGRL